MLKQQAKMESDEDLVDFVTEYSNSVELTTQTELAMSSFFNTGHLNYKNRVILENCYVLLKNYLCIGLDGQIYQTHMVKK